LVILLRILFPFVARSHTNNRLDDPLNRPVPHFTAALRQTIQTIERGDKCSIWNSLAALGAHKVHDQQSVIATL
jgi:hypothetical protein